MRRKPDADRISADGTLCARCGHVRSSHSAWKWDAPHPCEVTVGGECLCEDFEERKDYGPMADLNLYLWWRRRK